MVQPREHAIALYMEGIRDGHAREAVTAHTGARYTQHSTGVADGREGFIAFFEPFLARNPVRDIRVIRSLQDGPHVFVHAYQSLNHGDAEWITTDFFDSDDAGLIVEHWDVIGGVFPPNASGRDAYTGPSDVVDHDKTAKNKALVLAFMEEILIGGNTETQELFFADRQLLQHDPQLPDGVDPYLAQLGEGGLSYQACFLAVGEGNFVATLNRARRAGQDICRVDLFRVHEGKIVETWCNEEPVPPKEEWANSGKF